MKKVVSPQRTFDTAFDSSRGEGHPARFWVLGAYTMLSGLQGMLWFAYSPVVREVKAFFPYVTDDVLDMFDSWNSICYFPMAFVVIWLLTLPRGLQRVVRLGAVLCCLGTSLRCLALMDPAAKFSIYFLHLGQMFNGLLGPCVVAPPSLLSALWFPHSESTRATAAGVLSNNVGNAAAFFLSPFLVDTFGMRQYFYIHLAMSWFVFACVFVNFPARPPTPPSAAACILTAAATSIRRGGSSEEPTSPLLVAYHPEDGDRSFSEFQHDIYMLSRHGGLRILCLAYAWNSGGFVAWTSLWDLIMSSELSYSDSYIGLLSFTTTIAYILAGAITAYMVDRYWAHKMKAVILVSFGVAFVFSLLFTLSVPSLFSEVPLLKIGSSRRVWLLIIAFLVGLPNGSAAPVFYEFAAQLTYPVCEGSSASALSFFESLGALFLYQFVARACSTQSMNLIYTIGMALCIPLLVFIKEDYVRDELDKEIRSTTEATPLLTFSTKLRDSSYLRFQSYDLTGSFDGTPMPKVPSGPRNHGYQPPPGAAAAAALGEFAGLTPPPSAMGMLSPPPAAAAAAAASTNLTPTTSTSTNRVSKKPALAHLTVPK